MSEKYGRENLRGLGYNWTDTTIEYVIGLKKEQFQKAVKGIWVIRDLKKQVYLQPNNLPTQKK